MKKKFKDITKEEVFDYLIQNKPIVCFVNNLCYIVKPDSIFSEEIMTEMKTIGQWKVLLEEK